MLPNLSFDLIARDLTGKAFSSVGRSVAGAESRFGRFAASLGGIGASMTKLGAGMTAGISAPLAMIGKDMLDRARDAQEAASAFDAVFEGNAASVRKWAAETAKAMGRSEFALQDQAAAFQGLFAAAAPTTDEAAKMATQFAGLAQDLASFYNVSESDALDKLRSGLSGQSEPMRRFNVFLNEGAVKAKALEMGLGGAKGALTDQAKIMARAQLILEATTKAQGDAVKTSGSLSNRSKALAGAWNDLAVKLGTVMLPLATRLVASLAKLTQWFSNLSPETQEWIVIAGGAAVVLGPMIAALGTMAMGVAALAPMLPVLGGAIAALAGPVGLVVLAFAGIAAAWAKWDVIREKFPGFAAAVETGLRAGQAALQTFWTALLNWNEGLMALFSGDFAGAWAIAKTAIDDFSQLGVRVFEVLFPGALEASRAKLAEIGTAIVAMKDMAIAAVQALVAGVTEWISGKLNAVWDGAVARIDRVKDSFFRLYDAVVGHSYVPDMVEGIGSWMGKLDGLMVVPALDAASRTADAFKQTGDSMASMFEGFGSSIAEAIKGTKSWTDVLLDALSVIGKMLLSKMDFGGGLFGGLLKGVLGGLFGGAFAGGGVLGGGKIGLVGEKGPELISAGASPLRVTPLEKNGGAAQAVHVTVGISADNNGNILPFVQSVAQKTVSGAMPGMVKASVAATFGEIRSRPGALR